MKFPLQNRYNWSAFDNVIDHHGYEAICGEFGVDYKQVAAACHLGDNNMPSNDLGIPLQNEIAVATTTGNMTISTTHSAILLTQKTAG